MSEQFRATDENWADLEGYGGAVPNCLRELRDRVMCMDACIRDIYTQIDELKQRCDWNYSKACRVENQVEKLAERGIDLGAAVLAGADGPAPVAGEGSLVSTVAGIIAGVDVDIDFEPQARAAVLAVADWLQAYSKPGKPGKDGCGWWVAKRLRREVGK